MDLKKSPSFLEEKKKPQSAFLALPIIDSVPTRKGASGGGQKNLISLSASHTRRESHSCSGRKLERRQDDAVCHKLNRIRKRRQNIKGLGRHQACRQDRAAVLEGAFGIATFRSRITWCIQCRMPTGSGVASERWPAWGRLSAAPRQLGSGTFRFPTPCPRPSPVGSAAMLLGTRPWDEQEAVATTTAGDFLLDGSKARYFGSGPC